MPSKTKIKPDAKPATKTPPSPAVLRRRTALAEAGLEHGAAAEAIERRQGIPTTGKAVTGTINNHYRSGGLRIERGLVELLRERFVELGKTGRAKEMTLDYFGWGT